MDKRLLIFTKEFYPYASGSGINAKYFAEYLVRNGWKVQVLTLNYFFRLKTFDCIKGVRVFRVPMPMITPYFVRTVSSLFVFPFYVIPIIRSKRIMLYGPITGYFGIILFAWAFRKQVIFQSVLLDGDDISTILKKYKFIKSFVSFVFARLSVYHAITPEFEGRFRDEIKKIRGKVLQCGQGVDQELFKAVDVKTKMALRKRFNLPLESPILLSVGNLIKRKGYSTIFNALAKLDDDFLYLIIGNFDNNERHFFWHNGDEMNQLYEQGIELLEDKVRFIGFVDNTHEYMQAVDLFIHNGLQEGYPNVLIEAESVGLEIIAPQYGTKRATHPFERSFLYVKNELMSDLS